MSILAVESFASEALTISCCCGEEEWTRDNSLALGASVAHWTCSTCRASANLIIGSITICVIRTNLGWALFSRRTWYALGSASHGGCSVYTINGCRSVPSNCGRAEFTRRAGLTPIGARVVVASWRADYIVATGLIFAVPAGRAE